MEQPHIDPLRLQHLLGLAEPIPFPNLPGAGDPLYIEDCVVAIPLDVADSQTRRYVADSNVLWILDDVFTICVEFDTTRDSSTITVANAGTPADAQLQFELGCITAELIGADVTWDSFHVPWPLQLPAGALRGASCSFDSIDRDYTPAGDETYCIQEELSCSEGEQLWLLASGRVAGAAHLSVPAYCDDETDGYLSFTLYAFETADAAREYVRGSFIANRVELVEEAIRTGAASLEAFGLPQEPLGAALRGMLERLAEGDHVARTTCRRALALVDEVRE